MRHHPLAAAVAVLFSAPMAHAAEPTTLTEILVTAPRPSTVPLSRGVVSSALLNSLPAATSDTASLLRDIPGVSLYGAGGVSSLPSIHGLADDRLRIQVDGMDLIAACPNHMNPALSYIDPSDVESIKVYAGAAPVSVGGDSIGGAIVVKSEKPRFAEPGAGQTVEAELGSFYRSNGDGRGVNAKAALVNESVNLTYTGAYAKSDNYHAAKDFKGRLYVNPANAASTGRVENTLELDEVGSTAYETSNQSLGLAWRLDEHQVEFKVTHQGMPHEGFANQRMDMTENESDKFNLAYESRQRWGLLKARAYHEVTDHAMDFGPDKRYWYGPGAPPAGSGGDAAVNGAACTPISGTVAGVGCAAGMPMFTYGKTTGLALNGELALAERDILRVGGEYQSYRLEDWWTPSGAGMWPNTFQNINGGKRDRYAVFGEWESIFSNGWTGQAGLRHETVRMSADAVHGYNLAAAPTAGAGGMGNQTTDAVAFNNASRRKTDHNWDLSLLARYAPSTNQTIEIGVAQKTRSPNLYERYTWSSWQMAALMNNFVGDGNGYFGDINLKPEVAHTLSVAVEWRAPESRAWSIRATPYFTRVKDYIDAVQWNGDAATGTVRAANLTNQYTVLRYANASARLYGLDLSGQMQLTQGTALGDFRLNGQINWAQGENTETGDGLYNIMPLNGKLILNQKWGRWNTLLEAMLVAGKDTVSAERNEVKTSGYSLFNLRGSYEWKQARLDFGVENLLDRAYVHPLSGAYVGQGATMTLTAAGVVPQWGTATPGAGRNFYVGGSMKF